MIFRIQSWLNSTAKLVFARLLAIKLLNWLFRIEWEHFGSGHRGDGSGSIPIVGKKRRTQEIIPTKKTAF